METRANYILIGAFALVGFLGILGFFLWFANIELDRQFAYYDIDFGSVSGLSNASDVRFAGLPVGQVVDVRLSPQNDGRVRVRVEIDAETPVRQDSVATIEAQGVTGVSYVGISAGTPESPLLKPGSGDAVPMIDSGQSVLQSLSQDAPEILAETLQVVRELRQLIGGENQRRVQTVLENVEQSSASFALALEDFSQIASTVSTFASEIDRFNTTLDALTRDAAGALTAAEAAMASIEVLAEDARRVLAEGSGTLSEADAAIRTFDTYIAETLTPATGQLRSSVAEVEARIAAFGEQAGGVMATYTETGDEATARLAEARQTLAAANALIGRMDETLASLDSAARRFDAMIETSAEPLIVDLRVATAEATAVIRLVGETAEADLPAIFSEIRGATEAASAVVAQLGEDLSSASDRIDGLSGSAAATLESARVTFENANGTLAAITSALATGESALAAAETAFVGADRVINEDVAGIAARLRATLDQLEIAVGAVADEIPGVSAELRAASQSAEAAFAGIETAVEQSSPAFREFAATALPQFGRLAVETRELIDNLDILVEQIRRDPSRFFLDPRAPEYRR